MSKESEEPQDPNSTMFLVGRVKRGEPHALSDLFERYYPRLRRIVKSRLSEDLQQHVDPVDILQETFAQAAAKFDEFEFRNKNSLINFLSKIAEHKILESVAKIRTAKRDPHRSLPLEEDVAGREDTPSGVFSRREISASLRLSLGELPADQQEVIVMRYFAHFSHAEIAEATSRPSPDAARMFLKKAMDSLERVLRDRGCSSVDFSPGE